MEVESTTDKRLELARKWFPQVKVNWEGGGGKQSYLKVGNVLCTRCNHNQTIDEFELQLAKWFPETAKRMKRAEEVSE